MDPFVLAMIGIAGLAALSGKARPQSPASVAAGPAPGPDPRFTSAGGVAVYPTAPSSDPAFDYDKYQAAQLAAQAKQDAQSQAAAGGVLKAVGAVPVVGGIIAGGTALIGAGLEAFVGAVGLGPDYHAHWPPTDPNYDPYDWIAFWAHEGAVLGLPIGPSDHTGRNRSGNLYFNLAMRDLALRQAGGKPLSPRQQFFVDKNRAAAALVDAIVAPDAPTLIKVLREGAGDHELEELVYPPKNLEGDDLLGNPPADGRTYGAIIDANFATLGAQRHQERLAKIAELAGHGILDVVAQVIRDLDQRAQVAGEWAPTPTPATAPAAATAAALATSIFASIGLAPTPTLATTTGTTPATPPVVPVGGGGRSGPVRTLLF